MTIKIEKGIPIPEVKPKTPYGWPLFEMEIGDSFTAPNSAGKISNMNIWGKKNGMKFTKRVLNPEKDYADRTMRVWRIA